MILLKEEVVKQKIVEVVTKKALYANRCSCCGKVFTMDKYCNDQMTPSNMKGIFNGGSAYIDENGRSLGNMFSTTVCSFSCADEIFKGGWKKLGMYKIYANANAELVRVELGLTSLIKEKEELLEEWDLN